MYTKRLRRPALRGRDPLTQQPTGDDRYWPFNPRNYRVPMSIRRACQRLPAPFNAAIVHMRRHRGLTTHSNQRHPSGRPVERGLSELAFGSAWTVLVERRDYV